MIRSAELQEQIEGQKQTEDEAFRHLKKTFDDACNNFPEIMKPYRYRNADIESRSEATQFMRTALQETINRRYPPRTARRIGAEE